MIKLYLLKKFDSSNYYHQIKLSTYRNDKLLSATHPLYINEQYLTQMFFNYLIKNYYQSFIDIDVVKGDNGKPEFINKELHFSIAHNQDYIIVGFDKDALGVDIESNTRTIKKNNYEINHNYLNDKTDIEKWILLESANKLTKRGISGIINNDDINKINLKMIKSYDLLIGVASFNLIKVNLANVSKKEVLSSLK